MNKIIRRNNIYMPLATVMLLVIGLFAVPKVYAEGSREIYPNGALGSRAYLRASTSETAAFPFANLGTHFVYAKAGETIAIATDAQKSTSKRIFLYSPTGADVTPTGNSSPNATRGNIPNRAAEKMGPRLPGVTSGDGYTPIYYTVPANGEGIYKVEFRGGNGNTTGDARYSATTTGQKADEWPSLANNNYLVAWDISVANTSRTAWIPGRVYANVLNMDDPSYNSSNSSFFATNSGFYGNFKVLTRDGYIYNVNNNGMQGISFTFMVNNRGFHVEGNPNTPSYKSIAANTAAAVKNRYHNPNTADAEAAVTHKIFYNLPDETMPERTIGGPVNGQETWLRIPEKDMNVSELKVVGVEGGSNNQLGNKGAYIEFYNESGGDYYIKISSKEGSTATFPPRELSGSSSIGDNRIYWDGKDGNGQPLPHGISDVNVELKLRGAEVHFPYIDMELNHFGIILELLNKETNYTTVISDKVYWDDSGIGNGGGNNGSKTNPINASHTVIPEGTSSNVNGHIWGTGSNSTSDTFGDNMGMDTWTFIEGDAISVDFEVDVRVADLYTTIEELSSNTFEIGDEITYTVKAGNKGPSDVKDVPFSFILPTGFEYSGNSNDITFTSICGTESTPITYDPSTNTFNSRLDLDKDCEVVYTFKVTISEDSDPSNTKAFSTIMRPADVTDPDATNISNPEKPEGDPNGVVDVDNYYYLPTDPFFEVEHNGKGGVSNNIDEVSLQLIRLSDLEIKKTADKEEAKVSDEVVFTLTIKNNGPHHALGVVVTDTIPAGYSNISNISNEGTYENGIIKWEIGELANEEVKTVTFKATVNAAGPYLNIAAVDGDVEDPDLSNNVSTYNPVTKVNYWIGGTINKENTWNEPNNWTANRVPENLEDIEFATEDNNPTVEDNPKSGPAREDLHLDEDRNIGDLINKSDKDLIVTLENQLKIYGEVPTGNTGGIVVQADPEDEKAAGTLLFDKPNDNQNVEATVQFYSKAHECADCGFYRNSWQYFGIPLQSGNFPYQNPMVETVNQWVESFNGNKWQSAPYTPDSELKAFKGYQITSKETEKPDYVYDFEGKLYVDDASVALTKTASVNYAGANLVGNSYTGAIPIKEGAIIVPEGFDKVVYLFNTGTRDQWRKLNGTLIHGYKRGQYLAVPINLGGQEEFPDRIPSSHSFMVLAAEGSAETLSNNLEIKYAELTKNTTVNRGDGSQIVTRSKSKNIKDSNSASGIIPSLTIDVVGEESVDRVWIFSHKNTTHGFDDGWDGRKMMEEGVAQLYVAGSDESKLQVATVPELNNVILGFVPEMGGRYTLDFSASANLKGVDIFITDLKTGKTERVGKDRSYTFEAKEGDLASRFKLSYAAINTVLSSDELLIDVVTSDRGEIKIANSSRNSCSVFISDSKGNLLQQIEVASDNESIVNSLSKGTYMIRLQNAELNDVRKIVVE